MQYILFLSFLLCGILPANAQLQKIKGKIINAGLVEGIHVLNATQNQRTITNATGQFEIHGVLGDTIQFKAIHFQPQEVVITNAILNSNLLQIQLTPLVNNLEPVELNTLPSKNLEAAAKQIPTATPLNFNDVGIPGFKGVPRERIPTVLQTLGTVTSFNIEAIYKHISGYYKKLRIKRSWDTQNQTLEALRTTYTDVFLQNAYEIPPYRVEEFLWFCMETSSIQSYFRKGQFALVLGVFDTQSKVFLKRINTPKEKE